MKQLRIIGVGLLVWIIGVSLFTLSYFIPILQNPDTQANLFLSIGILPTVWFGTRLYYKNRNKTKGFWVGLGFFITAFILDASLTVPFLIVPQGGSYHEFFTSITFWLIGVEIIATASLYWYINRKNNS